MNLIKIQGYYLGLMVAISLGAVSCTNETEFANSLDKGDITFSAQVGKTMSRTTESAWDGDRCESGRNSKNLQSDNQWKNVY